MSWCFAYSQAMIRGNLDRHDNYIVAAIIAGAA
jgi:hypothetical protein